MKTYPAHKILSSEEIENGGKQTEPCFVWWNGTKLCASYPALLAQAKDHVIDGLDWHDGEAFFHKLSRVYNSGYGGSRKVQVDENGNEV